MLHMHYLQTPGLFEGTELQQALPEHTQLTWGPMFPDPPEFSILVAGYPTVEQLEASPRLDTLLIPWAGLPVPTRQALSHFPHLAIHNIHHNHIAVAESALALLLTVAKQILPYDRTFRQHDWRPRFTNPNAGVRLFGKTALILGYGSIGKHIAHICRAFGMKILALRRDEQGIQEHERSFLFSTQALPQLLPHAQVLFVCLPLTEKTEGILGANELAMLPTNALLVNVGRGEVIDESALFHALQSRQLSGAGLDVWYRYPTTPESRAETPPSHYPFHTLDNVVMSPHRADRCDDNERLRIEHIVQFVEAYQQHKPLPNPVCLHRGY